MKINQLPGDTTAENNGLIIYSPDGVNAQTLTFQQFKQHILDYISQNRASDYTPTKRKDGAGYPGFKDDEIEDYRWRYIQGDPFRINSWHWEKTETKQLLRRFYPALEFLTIFPEIEMQVEDFNKLYLDYKNVGLSGIDRIPPYSYDNEINLKETILHGNLYPNAILPRPTDEALAALLPTDRYGEGGWASPSSFHKLTDYVSESEVSRVPESIRDYQVAFTSWNQVGHMIADDERWVDPQQDATWTLKPQSEWPYVPEDGCVHVEVDGHEVAYPITDAFPSGIEEVDSALSDFYEHRYSSGYEAFKTDPDHPFISRLTVIFPAEYLNSDEFCEFLNIVRDDCIPVTSSKGRYVTYTKETTAYYTEHDISIIMSNYIGDPFSYEPYQTRRIYDWLAPEYPLPPDAAYRNYPSEWRSDVGVLVKKFQALMATNSIWPFNSLPTITANNALTPMDVNTPLSPYPSYGGWMWQGDTATGSWIYRLYYVAPGTVIDWMEDNFVNGDKYLRSTNSPVWIGSEESEITEFTHSFSLTKNAVFTPGETYYTNRYAIFDAIGGCVRNAPLYLSARQLIQQTSGNPILYRNGVEYVTWIVNTMLGISDEDIFYKNFMIGGHDFAKVVTSPYGVSTKKVLLFYDSTIESFLSLNKWGIRIKQATINAYHKLHAGPGVEIDRDYNIDIYGKFKDILVDGESVVNGTDAEIDLTGVDTIRAVDISAGNKLARTVTHSRGFDANDKYHYYNNYQFDISGLHTADVINSSHYTGMLGPYDNRPFQFAGIGHTPGTAIILTFEATIISPVDAVYTAAIMPMPIPPTPPLPRPWDIGDTTNYDPTFVDYDSVEAKANIPATVKVVKVLPVNTTSNAVIYGFYIDHNITDWTISNPYTVVGDVKYSIKNLIVT